MFCTVATKNTDEINQARSQVWNSCALYIKSMCLPQPSEEHCSTEIYLNERDEIQVMPASENFTHVRS